MLTKRDQTLNYLGICQKAHKLMVGTEAVADNMASKKMYLVIVANDASLNAIDKIVKKCFFYKIDVIQCYSTAEISHAIGMHNVKTLAITDQNLASVFAKQTASLQEEVN